MSDSQYKPGIYTKDGRQRTAHTASDAVALVFDGYRRTAPLPTATSTAPVPQPPKASEPKTKES